MTWQVLILPKAEADIRGMTSYLQQHSLSGATAWVTALEHALEHLAEFAEGCPEADENPFF